MKYIIKSIKKYKIYALFVSLICLLSPFATVFTSNAMGELTEHFAESGLNNFSNLIVVTIALYLLEVLLEYLFLMGCGKMKAYAYSAIQKKSYEKLANLPIDNPIMSSTGDIYNRISNDTTELVEFLSETAPTILRQSFQLIITLSYLFLLDRRVTAVYFIVVLISVTLQAIISKIMKKAGAEVKRCEVDMNTQINDVLRNRIVVKSYNGDDFLQNLCEERGIEYAKAKINFSLLSMPLKIVGILCGMIPILSVCIYGLYLIPKGLMEISVFMSIFYLCQKVVPKQLHYVDLLIEAVKIKPSADRIAELWQERNKNEQGPEQTKLIDGSSIKLMEVSYRYFGEAQWALRDISLEIEPGKKVAFIGENGCGKSSVLKLIAGLLSPQEGSIERVEAVITAQFPYLFSDTIRSNILYGKAHSSKEATKLDMEDNFSSACEYAELSTFTDILDCGLDTALIGNGGNLSGGQRQRIAVARALYSKSNILLFDESVSALDADTSKKLIKNILLNTPKTTIIMVLHQMELLQFFDEIFMFDKGRLVFNGTYEALKKSGLYSTTAMEEEEAL